MINQVNTYAEKHGFEEMLTGGGCTAFTNTFEMPDNSMFLITEEDGCNVPETMDEACVVGRYTDGMDVCLATRKGTFDQCIEIALEAKENWENAEHYSMEILCYHNERVDTIKDITHENK